MKASFPFGGVVSTVVLALLCGCVTRSPLHPPSPKADHAAQLQWWRDARFGMFIHWGPVSLKGTEIGWSRGQEIPFEIYDNLYREFNPTNFNANQWMKVARDAGMKYIVFTTKHHDGFCMWDTKQTDFNIMRSPFGRDVVGELAAACKGEGLAFGTYHSVCDWRHPDFPLGSPGGKVRKPNPDLERYTQYFRNQVSELITGYGPLLLMWFDVPQEFDASRGQETIDFARSLQPNLIVNDRSGAPGDYDTPEQRIGSFQMNRPWETCMTICQQWAWKPDDRMKSFEECLRALVLCAGGDGNLLFNVGPMPDGRIEPRQIERLKEMGAWLAKYGKTIYGTRGGPFKPTKTLASTRKGNVVYVHVLKWNGETVKLPGIARKIVSASLVTGGRVAVNQTAEEITLTVPKKRQREIDTIVQLKLDGSAMDIRPVALASNIKATASNVYQQQIDNYGPENAFDGTSNTRWATDSGTKQAWIAVDYGKPATFDGLRIDEDYGKRVQRFELQIKDGADWKTFFSGATIGAGFKCQFPPVTAKEVRLNILDANEGPTISEIALLRKE